VALPQAGSLGARLGARTDRLDPATHAAHHGKHQADGVTHYTGNYGNLLFFWGVPFGTAKITRRCPEAFGLENLPEERWRTELAWPVVPMAGAAGAEVPAPEAA